MLRIRTFTSYIFTELKIGIQIFCRHGLYDTVFKPNKFVEYRAKFSWNKTRLSPNLLSRNWRLFTDIPWNTSSNFNRSGHRMYGYKLIYSLKWRKNLETIFTKIAVAYVKIWRWILWKPFRQVDRRNRRWTYKCVHCIRHSFYFITKPWSHQVHILHIREYRIASYCVPFNVLLRWHAVAQLIEAMRYKPEGRGFDSRWRHWNFSLI
jgi:hypothetical protein